MRPGGTATLLIVFGWWFEAPVVLSVLGQVLQGTVASVLGGWTPVALQIKAESVTSAPVDCYAGVVQALVALSAAGRIGG